MRFVLCVFWLLVAFSKADEPFVLFTDFEPPGLSRTWRGNGEITAFRQTEATNSFVRIEAKKGAIFVTKPGVGVDFAVLGEMQFRLRVPRASEEDPLHLEVQIHSDSRPARFWRKLTVESSDWQTIAIPLHLFRPSSGAFLDWTEVRRFGLMFREATTLELDDISFVKSTDISSRHLMGQALNELAFDGKGSIHESEDFQLVTDLDLEPEPIFDELATLSKLISLHLPAEEKRKNKGLTPIVFFAREADYRAFWPRLGQAYNATLAEPTSQGFAALGIAGTFHDPKQPVRPVLIHEACHALLARRLGIGNKSEWLHEGLANFYQLEWTLQDLKPILRQQLNRKRILPLGTFTNGEALRTGQYAQAVSIIQWLFIDPKRREGFHKALTAFRKNTTTHLAPVAKDCFGKTITELDAEYRFWLREQVNP